MENQRNQGEEMKGCIIKNDEISIKIFAILLEMWTTIIGLLQILNVIQVTKR